MISFDGTGGVGPSLIRGRVPAALDEILVGPETLEDLGLAVGDTVDVYGQAGTWEHPGEETSMRARIVGIGVIPAAGGEARLGRGAVLTLDGVTRLNPDAAADGYWIRLTPDSIAGTVVAEFAATSEPRRLTANPTTSTSRCSTKRSPFKTSSKSTVYHNYSPSPRRSWRSG